MRQGLLNVLHLPDHLQRLKYLCSYIGERRRQLGVSWASVGWRLGGGWAEVGRGISVLEVSHVIACAGHKASEVRGGSGQSHLSILQRRHLILVLLVFIFVFLLGLVTRLIGGTLTGFPGLDDGRGG